MPHLSRIPYVDTKILNLIQPLYDSLLKLGLGFINVFKQQQYPKIPNTHPTLLGFLKYFE